MHVFTEEFKEQRNEEGLDKQGVCEECRKLGSWVCFPRGEVAFSSWYREDYNRTCVSTISEFKGAKGSTSALSEPCAVKVTTETNL